MTDDELAEVAESDAHAQSVLDQHIPSGPLDGRRRCAICESWWPCDLVSLAALAVLRRQERDELLYWGYPRPRRR